MPSGPDKQQHNTQLLNVPWKHMFSSGSAFINLNVFFIALPAL